MRLGNSVLFGLVAVTLLGCSSDDREIGQDTGGTGGATGGSSGKGGSGGSGGSGATGGSSGTGGNPSGGAAGAGGADSACTQSGGTVDTGLCCSSTSDFPNTCQIGACGCSLDNSHNVKVCNCPSGMCFDGNQCAAAGGAGGGGGSGGSDGGSGGVAGGGATGGSGGGGGAAQECVNSGGSVTTTSCCQSAGDFPDTCSIGACGCAPQYSHDVQTCSCPAPKCFNGTHCV